LKRPSNNLQNRHERKTESKESWGLQTLAALKFAGMAEIRKRK
jgi:hypothetical protein